jgi:hypothetical protein
MSGCVGMCPLRLDVHWLIVTVGGRLRLGTGSVGRVERCSVLPLKK